LEQGKGQADDLKLALAYRDHIHEAIIDRGIGPLIREQGADAATAFALLNEGWGWTNRSKSQ
jgi:hypothetical protein